MSGEKFREQLIAGAFQVSCDVVEDLGKGTDLEGTVRRNSDVVLLSL